MSQLIHIRQRIKSIETIKKITHAMRLISMSVHADLKHKIRPLEQHNRAVKKLFQKMVLIAPHVPCTLLQPPAHTPECSLVILIGSQKGLCGSFNTGLFHLFKSKITTQFLDTHYIVIGKKAVDFARAYLKDRTIIAVYPNFSTSTRTVITRSIVDLICTAPHPYTHVSTYSNSSKTFFVQRPSVHTLIPLLDNEQTEPLLSGMHDYEWDQEPAELIQYLSSLYLEVSVENILFQSLFSEHAARFVSMDAATRNAESLLDATKLKYNKLRQAKITKELTELVGSNL